MTILRFSIIHFALLFAVTCLFTGCEKEEITDLNVLSMQEQQQKGTCNKIYINTDWKTVTWDQFSTIQNKLVNSGISIVAGDCEVLLEKSLSYNELNSVLLISSSDDDTVTFRFDNLQIICFDCLFNPPLLCGHFNETLHVTIGKNGCTLGSFVYDSQPYEYVTYSVQPLIQKYCAALDCPVIFN